MDLRRLSRMLDLQKFQPERSAPRPSKKGGLEMLVRRQLPNALPELRPTPNSSRLQRSGSARRRSARINVVHPPSEDPLSEPSYQLPPVMAHSVDDLDGIALLPPTSVRGKSVTKQSNGNTQSKSRIPQYNSTKASGCITKRKSIVTAKKRLSMSCKEPSKRTSHPRLQALARIPVPSPESYDDSAQFEADEIAMEMPTPAPNVSTRTSSVCQSMCTEVLQEVKTMHKEVVKSQKEFLAQQTEYFNRQNKLIQKQTEVLTKLDNLLDRNINFLGQRIGMDSTDKKENDCQGASNDINGQRAISQYNEIRSDFNFLSLKTPAKGLKTVAASPKTPRTLLSRTLQMQLGDIYEES